MGNNENYPSSSSQAMNPTLNQEGLLFYSYSEGTWKIIEASILEQMKARKAHAKEMIGPDWYRMSEGEQKRIVGLLATVARSGIGIIEIPAGDGRIWHITELDDLDIEIGFMTREEWASKVRRIEAREDVKLPSGENAASFLREHKTWSAEKAKQEDKRFLRPFPNFLRALHPDWPDASFPNARKPDIVTRIVVAKPAYPSALDEQVEHGHSAFENNESPGQGDG